MAEEIVIHTAQGDMEAEQVRSFLEAHGVQTFVRGEALRKTHGLTLDGLGEVAILVRPEQEAAARELMARVDRGELALKEDEEVRAESET